MRFVFVDVGTHDGQTLKEVTRSRWAFDLIIGLEPMPAQFANAQHAYGKVDRVQLFNFGLADRPGIVAIYGDNSDLGSSIFEGKTRGESNKQVTMCEMEEASAFFRQVIRDDDVVVVKLNCEGAEVPILNNLIDSGEINKIANVMIDFDIRKVPGEEHQEAAILERFASIGFTNFVLCEDVMHGRSHEMRIAAWLKSTGLTKHTRMAVLGDLANWGNYSRSRGLAAVSKARRLLTQ